MKRIRRTLFASLLTFAIASTAMAGNIGGLKTNRTGNIGGLRTTAAGNIGGLRTNATGNIGGLRTEATELTRERAEASHDTLYVRFAGNIGGLLSFFFSIF